MTKEKTDKKRTIVVPGEVIASGKEFLPGDGTRREGKDIIALKFGLLEKSDKLVKVIPLSGAYIPRTGNTVIGQVTDLTFNGWFIDVGAPHLGFLPVAECAGYINKKDLAEHYAIGDTLVCKVRATRTKSVELTMKDQTCKKLNGGFLMSVNPTRVPRVIGRAGSMVSTIKNETGCSIIVGQNGMIWIKGRDIQSEMLARDAITLIVEKPFIDGLTDQVKDFLNKRKNG
ncbi:MAG: RNA-binding protein [archaeon]|nr:MAG: RNA-binding protein [archaeon]